MGMMDETVDMAQTILRQLSELSTINSQFALEMSVQHEVKREAMAHCCFSFFLFDRK
jgi:hypothetical protein